MYLTNSGTGQCAPYTDTIGINFVDFQGTNTITPINASCYGSSSGSANISTVGTVTPYSYLWNTTPSQTGSNATNIPNGTYTVDVTDGNGCVKQESFTVAEPQPLTATYVTTNASCFFGSDGSATVTPFGGTAPYTYSWAPSGGSNATATGLSAGTYNVTITDSKNCDTTISITITQPPVLVSSISNVTHVRCFGNSTGQATVNVNGGTPGYTYTWSPSGGNAQTAVGLAAGNYSITVTDSKGCSSIANVVINQPAATISATQSQTEVTCFGGSDGSAAVVVSGGSPPYSYSWSPSGGSGSSASGLTAGNYTVTISDTGNCTLPKSFVITQPAELVANPTFTSSTCGLSNGTINANVGGGTPGYVYSWSTGDTTANISNVMAGTYSVIVTDNHNCVDTATVVLTNATPALVATINTSNNVSCFGGNDGSALVTVTGGTATFTYTWTPIGGNTATGTNLIADDYLVTVTDVNGCSDTSTITITEPATPVTISLSQTNVSCNGGNNGQAIVTPSGGTPNYSYLWSNADADSIAGNLSANTYTLTVTDANGCSVDSSVVITQPNLLTATITKTNVSCNGGNDGQAIITPTGGTTPYSYLWSNADADSIAGNLVAGTYSVTVTDALGCTYTDSVVITQPQALSFTFSHTDVSCNGGNDGLASVIVSGGTLPFTYSWSNGGNTSSINGLIAGTYTLTVTDGKGCSLLDSVVVSEPAVLALTSTDSDVLCFGENTGTSTVHATGGNVPYNYNWSPSGGSDSTATGLTVGTYTVVVVDNKGCTDSIDVVINEPALLTTTLAQTNVSCFGGNNGEFIALPVGGMAPYTYLWSNADTDSIAGNLVAGNYSVTVTDDNGCTSLSSGTISQPALLVSTIGNVVNVSCFGGNDAHATISSAGGTTPYTYLWSNGVTTATASNLTAGTYIVSTTDSLGCTDNDTIIITQPTAPLTSTTNSIDNPCFGDNLGSGYVTASGGTTPYTYLWGPIPSTNDSISGLAAGIYTVVVTDTLGCTTNDTIIINDPALLTIVLSQTNVSCNGGNNGQAIVTPSGGTPNYSYLWSNADADSIAGNLSANTYTLTVTDANGCSVDSSVVITQPNLLTATITKTNVSCNGGNDGQAIITPTGGTTPYSYLWSNADADSIAGNLVAGTYSVTVTDALGCTYTDSVVITQPQALSFTFSHTDVSCNGGNDGLASVIVSGGTLPFTYSWSNGGNTSSINGLIAGTYTLTVTDGKGCSLLDSVVVSEPAVLALTSTDSDVLCFGENTGTSTVHATGGNVPYNYNWSPSGGSDSTATGLTVGTYTVVVVDNKGCTDSIDVVINEPAVLDVSLTQTEVKCFGTNDGEIVALPTGGMIPYSYLWSNADIDSIANNVAAGNYSITVTDANGCTVSDNTTVTQPALLVSNINNSNNVSCFGGNDGDALVSTSGGTTPYTYLWSTTSTSTSISNLVADTYTVITTDNMGCTDNDTIIITQPTAPLTLSMAATHNTCFGANQGLASVAPSGGTAPYTYLWSPIPSTNDTLFNLAIGTYVVTVTDTNGCIKKDSITITQPTRIISSSSTVTSTCGVANGEIHATVSGGTPGYTYFWLPGGFTTLDVTGITSGSYTFYVTDAVGCVDSSIVNVGSTIKPTLTIDSIFHVSCFGGNNGFAYGSATGGTAPLSYLWLTSMVADSMDTNLSAGQYVLQVTDSIGCQDFATVEITEPDTLQGTLIPTDVLCNGGNDGSIEAFVSGGTTPYSYSWSGNSDLASISDSLIAGTYTLTVTDSNGCSFVDSALVSEPGLLSLNMSGTNINCFGGNDGTAQVVATGGTPNYVYVWSNGQGGTSLNGLIFGTYSVLVTDDNGCFTSDSITLTQPAAGLSLATTSTNVSCNGGNDGEFVVIPNGGTTPYSYLWSNADTDSIAENLIAGIYSVNVTDSNGCSAMTSGTVTQPTQLISNINTTVDVSCFGGNDGLATVTTSGGTTPYVYLWSTGDATTTTSNLIAGTYWVTTTDNKGCTDADTVEITEPLAPLTTTTNSTDNLCFGDSEGSGYVTPSGGTAPYTYLWSPIPSVNDSIEDLPIGTYYVTVTDTLGCTVSDSITINEPTLLTISLTQTNVSCNGGNNGEAIVTPAGGTPNYTYLWSNADADSIAENLAANTITVLVTDANGCSENDAVTITQPTLLTGTLSKTNVSCSGGNDGTATVVATGGTTPYTYLWSNGVVNPTATNLIAGTYTVTVTDSLGCSFTDSIIITQPLPLGLTFSQTNVSCFSGNDGTASVIATGGTLPYTYAWSNGDIDSLNTGLIAGTYTLTVTDGKGCNITDSVTITEPTLLSSTMATVDVGCYGANTGSAVVTVAGGTLNYGYSWSNGQGSDTITALVAGTYVVTITDGKGCTLLDTAIITQPSAGLSLATTSTNVSCNGGNDGEFVVIPNGGTTPYSYLWSNADTDSIAENLIAGIYSVNVTDSNGCSAVINGTVTQPTQLISNINTTVDVSCFGGNDGLATVTTSGGTTPYVYLWSTGDATTTTSNLIAGTYWVTTTDNKGCTDADTVEITEPLAPLTTTTNSTDNLCFGDSEGSGYVTPSGGTAPYTYLWSPIPSVNDSIEDLPIGTYYVTVTDTLGCTVSDSITINEPTLLTISLTQTNVSCNGGNNGEAIVTPAGGTPNYTYLWSNADADSIAENLAANTITVLVTDANGCSENDAVTITQPTLLTGTLSKTNVSCSGGNDGTATVVATGGTTPYTYLWSNGVVNPTATNLIAGTYTVTVTDSLGCSFTDSIIITQPLPLGLTFSQTNVSCFSGNDGTASVIATGGTLPYTYAWSNGDIDSLNTGLIAGTYTLTVTDGKGCNITDSVTITEPTLLSSTMATVDVGCYGANTGSAVVTVAGGTLNYGYSWSNGQGSDTITALVAGTYVVTITDGKGCTLLDTAIITQPSAGLSLATTSTNVSCNGGNDGEFVVIPNGGTTPYSYLWSNADTDSIAENLIAGIYSVNVTDSNGCSIDTILEITEPTILTTSIVNVVNTFCGLSNGSALVTATGGTSPYTYLWSNTSTTDTLTNVLAGFYSVTTTDFNGCSNTDTITIFDVPNPQVSITTSTNVLCFGGNSGTATATPTLGVPPYTYMWAPTGNNIQSPSNLMAGTHYVTLTDANGCTSTDSIVINQPSALSITIDSITTVSCFGYTDGEIMVTGNGGTPSYTYIWSNGDTTSTISNLPSGAYTLTLKDSNNCSLNQTIVVQQPAILNASIQINSDELCIGSNNGSATVTHTGGTPPFTYSWNTTPTQNSIISSNLAPGNYIVTVTDIKGCTDTSSTTIGSPTPVITNNLPDQTICYGNSVSLSGSATGGSGNYIYFWNNSIGIANPAVLSPTTTTTYMYNAIDGNGCIGTTDTVKINVQSLFQSDVDVYASSNICPGTEALIYAAVSNPNTGTLTYNWNNSLPNSAGAFQLVPTQPTTYILTVTNQCGVSITDSATVNFKPLPTPNFIGSGAGCQPFTVSFTDQSTTPVDSIISWDWNFGDGNTGTGTQTTNSYLNSGTYSVSLTVTTNQGCVNDTTINNLITVYPDPIADFTATPLVTNLDEAVITFINQSIDGVSYSWDFNDNNTSIEFSPSHTYSDTGTYYVNLLVTSQNGCESEYTLPIIVEPSFNFQIPNAFSPNPNGSNGGFYDITSLSNDVFYPFVKFVRDYNFMIFNRWGELIFETNDVNIGWDGYYKGSMCQQDVYVWKVDLIFINGKKLSKAGDVTLIR
ncbi:MAG: PKD domain-containing protein [Flavobacteriales bacterium]